MKMKNNMFMNPPAPNNLKVDYRTYMTRLWFGWKKTKAATASKDNTEGLNLKAIDHTKTPFVTVSDMCAFHNTPVSTFYSRKKKGLSLEDCLKS